ncbi:hypothetical protein [Streptomyces sp. NPDC055099]
METWQIWLALGGGITGLVGGLAGLLTALHARHERIGRARLYPEIRAALAEMGWDWQKARTCDPQVVDRLGRAAGPSLPPAARTAATAISRVYLYCDNEWAENDLFTTLCYSAAWEILMRTVSWRRVPRSTKKRFDKAKREFEKHFAM